MSLTVTIPRRITHGEELVVLPREEYERIIRHNAEVVQALRVIAEGERAHREGKTIKASSLREALKIYAKKVR